MMQSAAKLDSAARRVFARRTAWIIGGIAFAIYAISIIEVVVKR